MKTVLFVCTGNIFRSLIAEYTLRAALPPGAGVLVASAGTLAPPQTMRPEMLKRLEEHGLDPSGHQQRRVTPEILAQADLVVAMGTDHRDFLREQFGRESTLFQELATGEATGVLDVHEALPDWQSDPAAVQNYVRSMVDRIHDAMPAFVQGLQRQLALEGSDTNLRLAR